MNSLLTALTNKISGSALSAGVGGRIYFDRAPANCEFPYIVYFIVAGSPRDTFKDKIEDIIIQFSLFSASEGATEITTMYSNLKTLFDDCSLTITGNTLIWMVRQGLTTMVEDGATPQGTPVKHWAVDYEIITQET